VTFLLPWDIKERAAKAVKAAQATVQRATTPRRPTPSPFRYGGGGGSWGPEPDAQYDTPVLGGLRRAGRALGRLPTLGLEDDAERDAPYRAIAQARVERGYPAALPGRGLNLGQTGSLAPDDAPLLVRELARPINYIGGPVRALSFARRAGVLTRVGTDLAAAGAATAAVEAADPWLQRNMDNVIARQAASLGLGAVAGGIGGLGAAGGARVLRGAEAQAGREAVRRAAPEAFQYGRALGDDMTPRRTFVQPSGQTWDTGIGMRPPRRPVPIRPGVELEPGTIGGGLRGGSAESTGMLPPQPKPLPPITDEYVAQLQAKIAREGMTPENRAALKEALGRSLGAITPDEQVARAPWNRPADPPTIGEALRNARIEERVGNRLGLGPDSPPPAQGADPQPVPPREPPFPRPSSVTKRFGARGIDGAPPEAVARYRAEVAAWRKYGADLRRHVEESNAWYQRNRGAGEQPPRAGVEAPTQPGAAPSATLGSPTTPGAVDARPRFGAQPEVTDRVLIRGDEAQLTGRTEQVGGRTFYEARLLEGHRAGETALVPRLADIDADAAAERASFTSQQEQFSRLRGTSQSPAAPRQQQPARPTQGALEGMGVAPRTQARGETMPAEQQGALFDRERYRRSFKVKPSKAPEFPLFEGGQSGADDVLAEASRTTDPTTLARRIPREQWIAPSQVDTRPDLFQARDAPPGEATDPRRVKQIVDNFVPERFEPITVVREGATSGTVPEGRYVVISGHHRLEAATQLGLPEIPIRVVDGDISSPAARVRLQNEAAIANFQVADPNVREVWRAARTLEQNGEDLVSIARAMRMTTDKVQRALDMGRAGAAVLDRAVSVPATADIAAEVGRAVRVWGLNPEDAFAVFDAYVRRGRGESLPSPAAVRRQLEKMAPELEPQMGLPGFDRPMTAEPGAPVFEAMRQAARLQDDLLKAERAARRDVKAVQGLQQRSGIAAPELEAAGQAEVSALRGRLAEVEREAVALVRAEREKLRPPTPEAPPAVADEFVPQSGPGLFDQPAQSAGNVGPGSVPETSMSRTLNPGDRTQAPSRYSSTQPLPADSTVRSATPSTQQRSVTVAPFGIDPSSNKPILHELTDPEALLAAARDAYPNLVARLEGVADELGAAFVGPRVKSERSLAIKLGRGVNPALASDYIGARLVADEVDAALEALAREGRIVADAPSNRFGYQARHISLEVAPGVTAEVQIMEPRIAAVQEFAHVYYDRLTKSGEDFLPEVKARLIAAGQYLYDHAPAVSPERAAEIQRTYQAGNHAIPPELYDVVMESRRIATGGGGLTPDTRSFADVRPGRLDARGLRGPAEYDALAAGPVQGPTLPPTRGRAQTPRPQQASLPGVRSPRPPTPPPAPAAAAPGGTGGGPTPPGAPPNQPGLPGMPELPRGERDWWDVVVDIANVPRSMQSSIDLSGSLRQAGWLAPRHRTAWKNAMAAQLKALVSDDAAQAIMRDLDAGEFAPLRREAGLYQSALDGAPLAAREEQFMSNIAGKLPGVKQTSRAYSVLLNKYRADLFDDFAARLSPEERTPARMAQYARYIEAATGRGHVGQRLQGMAPALNAVFFSPRFMASIPQRHLAAFTRDPKIRAEVIKDMGAFYVTGLGIMGAAVAAQQAGIAPGLRVDTDFNSPDWGKLRIGHTRIDIWGGQQQWARMVARVAQTASRRARGEQIKPSQNELAMIGQFLRYKASPNFNLEEQLRTGKDVLGDTAPGVSETALRLVAPIFLQELYDAYQVGGAQAAALTLPSAVGLGSSTYRGAEGIAPGEYKTMAPREQFEAIEGESWRRLRASAQFKDKLDGWDDYRTWRDAQLAHYQELRQKAGDSPEAARVNAARLLQRNATYKALVATKDLVETRWVREHTDEARRLWAEEQQKPGSEFPWKPTQEQIAIMEKAR